MMFDTSLTRQNDDRMRVVAVFQLANAIEHKRHRADTTVDAHARNGSIE